MAKKESLNKIPKKFRGIKRSFMDNISVNNSSSFMSFPKGLSFHGKEQGEEIILIIRPHWIVYLPQAVGAVLILILPWILVAIIPSLMQSFAIFVSLLLTALVIGISVLMDAILKWYYNVSIITDQRVMDLDFPNIMSHSMTEAQLEKIEDVTHKQIGAFGSVFDFGTVYVQTAGTSQNIEFQNIPRPRDVQDILVDLLESKQKGEI